MPRCSDGGAVVIDVSATKWLGEPAIDTAVTAELFRRRSAPCAEAANGAPQRSSFPGRGRAPRASDGVGFAGAKARISLTGDGDGLIAQRRASVHHQHAPKARGTHARARAHEQACPSVPRARAGERAHIKTHYARAPETAPETARAEPGRSRHSEAGRGEARAGERRNGPGRAMSLRSLPSPSARERRGRVRRAVVAGAHARGGARERERRPSERALGGRANSSGCAGPAPAREERRASLTQQRPPACVLVPSLAPALGRAPLHPHDREWQVKRVR